MKKRLHKILALALTLVMLLPLWPANAVDYDGHWSAEYIQEAKTRNWMVGYTDGSFRPDNSITRAEFSIMLWRALDEAEPLDNNYFTDVKFSEWYSDAVNALYEKGIVNGYGDGVFGPDDMLTREMGFTMLARAFDLSPDDENTYKKFSDSQDVSSWAQSATSALIEKGYVQGIGNNQLVPKKALTRGEMAKLLIVVFDGEQVENDEPKILNARADTNILYTTKAKDVIFYAEISNAKSDVYLTNNSKIVSQMVDDGQTSISGDEISGDGIYSIKVTGLTGNEADKTITFKVETEGATEDVVFMVATPINDEQINKQQNAQDIIEQYINNTDTVIPEKIIEELSSLSYINNCGVNSSGSAIWYVTEDGILGGYIIELNNPNRQTKGSIYNENDINLTSSSANLSASEMNSVGNEKVFIMSAFANAGLDPENYNNVTDSFRDKEYAVTRVINDDVTIEQMKDLSDFGVIAIDTHGDTFFDGNIFQDFWAWINSSYLEANEQVVILTREAATKENLKKYEDDVKAGRVVNISGYLAFTPAFIEHYYNNDHFSDTLVFAGSCYSLHNDTMANVFLSCGTKTYFGYSEAVLVSYDSAVVQTIFEELLNLKSSKEAYNNTIKAHGTNDGGNPSAYFYIRGDENLYLRTKGFKNGSFEEKFKGWAIQGDARIISQLESLHPQHGNNMAIISTGLGSVNESNSSISQYIVAEETPQSISFQYDWISEEPMEWVESQYDDQFLSVITTKDGNEIVLTSNDINSNPDKWLPIDGIDFDGGDDSVYHIGWTTVNIDLTQYSDSLENEFILEFKVWDKGDSIYDSAILLDNIVLS